MKRIIERIPALLLSILGLLLFSSLALAQQVTVRLAAPPPFSLTTENLRSFTIINSDSTGFNGYAVITVDEASAGRIATVTTRRFSIAPGMNVFTAANAPEIDNATYLPIYKDVIERTGRFPEGRFNICIELLDTGRVANYCLNHEVRMPQIRLISPSDGDSISELYPLFQWSTTPSASGIEYELKIVELFPDQVITDAINNIPHFIEKNLQITSFRYPVNAKTFEAGKTYVWQVTAFVEGYPIFQSETWAMQFNSSSGVAKAKHFINVEVSKGEGVIKSVYHDKEFKEVIKYVWYSGKEGKIKVKATDFTTTMGVPHIRLHVVKFVGVRFRFSDQSDRRIRIDAKWEPPLPEWDDDFPENITFAQTPGNPAVGTLTFNLPLPKSNSFTVEFYAECNQKSPAQGEGSAEVNLIAVKDGKNTPPKIISIDLECEGLGKEVDLDKEGREITKYRVPVLGNMITLKIKATDADEGDIVFIQFKDNGEVTLMDNDEKINWCPLIRQSIDILDAEGRRGRIVDSPGNPAIQVIKFTPSARFEMFGRKTAFYLPASFTIEFTAKDVGGLTDTKKIILTLE